MEWQRSGRKLFRGLTPKWDCFPFGGRQSGAGVTLSSFYFSAFPDRCKAIDMFKLFGCVGEVVEVVIPPRRNKFGRRFGFARFKEVVDERMVVVRLYNILIDGKKIHANQPRFLRNGRQEGLVVDQKRVEGPKVFIPGVKDQWVVKSKTFADIVQGGSKREESQSKEVPLVFSSGSELKSRWKKAYVGEVLFPGESYNIQTHLEIEGFFSIKVYPMGANLCLLEEMVEGFIKELLEEGKWWWQQWFKTIKPWHEKEVDTARVVWVRVYGVPCHAWSNDFFETLANRLGLFICLDENTMTGRRIPLEKSYMRIDPAEDTCESLLRKENSVGKMNISARRATGDMRDPLGIRNSA
ncbi:uncharacterized protein LOC131619025 [Vicia villosa]|uniref:uncharacterized protein LOC131619025 n=1 Tax=Vicia villosa TaxID=3911 RepID=UPI00273C532D|nr:uncharacterized protein LOC131619025 [Vicia villosa]